MLDPWRTGFSAPPDTAMDVVAAPRPGSHAGRGTTRDGDRAGSRTWPDTSFRRESVRTCQRIEDACDPRLKCHPSPHRGWSPCQGRLVILMLTAPGAHTDAAIVARPC